MSDTFDPFAPSTGLPDDFDAVIKAAWFEFDPEINAGQTLVLKMEMETTAEDFGPDGDGKGTLILSCGKGWDTQDRGATAVREDGNVRKGFHQSTAYHMFIDGAIKCDGAEKELRSSERGDPRKAAMWVGTAWHLKAKDVDYGEINGTQVGIRQKLVPNQFLGLHNTLVEMQRAGGGAPAAATGAVKKAAAPVSKAPAKAVAAVKKAAPAAPATTATGIDPELREQLKAIAMGAETHEQFVEQAFELAAVSEDDAAQQAVMDAAEGSIWAEAVAEYEAANS